VHARLAASDFSEHYLLPFLDVGIAMNGQNGQVTEQLVNFTEYGPGLPCGLCGKAIDMAELAYELMPDAERALRKEQARKAIERGDNPDHYWRGGERQLHTVGYLTTAAGALAAGYAEGMLTGAFAPPHSNFQFDIGKPRFGLVAPPRVREAGCTCGTHMGWGDAARSYRTVGLPEHFGKRGLLLFRGSP